MRECDLLPCRELRRRRGPRVLCQVRIQREKFCSRDLARKHGLILMTLQVGREGIFNRITARPWSFCSHSPDISIETTAECGIGQSRTDLPLRPSTLAKWRKGKAIPPRQGLQDVREWLQTGAISYRQRRNARCRTARKAAFAGANVSRGADALSTLHFMTPVLG